MENYLDRLDCPTINNNFFVELGIVLSPNTNTFTPSITSLETFHNDNKEYQ